MAGEVVAAGRFTADRRHAAELLPTIERLCRDAKWEPGRVDEVYVSSGPGSFTGVRIGVTVARTLALAVGAKLVRVPTLDVIARNALDATPVPDKVAVVLDAKRSQIYTALFRCADGRVERLIEATLAEPREFLTSACGDSSPPAVLGEGIPHHREAIDAAGSPVLPEELWPPRAEAVFEVGLATADAGEFIEPGNLLPNYIRPPEAEEVWARKHPNP